MKSYLVTSKRNFLVGGSDLRRPLTARPTFWYVFIATISNDLSVIVVVGKKFSTYTFLATEDVSLGPLGKIESQESGCKKKFQCFSRGYQRSIIVSSTGIITLIRKPSLGTQFNGFKKPTKVKARITCYCGYYISKYVTVNLFIFRYNFGDSILKSCVGELGSLVKENKKFDTGRGMAGSLHRMVRMVSKEKDPETFNEMMASARVDAALDEAINEIVKRYTTKYPGILIYIIYT